MIICKWVDDFIRLLEIIGCYYVIERKCGKDYILWLFINLIRLKYKICVVVYWNFLISF